MQTNRSARAALFYEEERAGTERHALGAEAAQYSAKIPNNPVVAAFVAALCKGGPAARDLVDGWMEESSGLVYRHHGRKRGVVEIGFSGALTVAEQWRLVALFDVFTIDVLVAILTTLSAPANARAAMYPRREPILLTAREIIDGKGLRRYGAERQELERKVALNVDLLCRMTVGIVGYPAKDPDSNQWDQRGVSIVGDRLIEAVEGGPAEGWRIRVGEWGRLWYNDRTTVWLVPLNKAVLSFDHRRTRPSQMLAKKIGITSTLLWGATGRPVSIERRIESLLRSIGELPLPERRTRHWAGRTRDRLEEAMLLLRETQVFRQVGYCGAFDVEEADRAKGWVAKWLSGKIAIRSPEDGPARRRKGGRPAARPAVPPAVVPDEPGAAADFL